MLRCNAIRVQVFSHVCTTVSSELSRERVKSKAGTGEYGLLFQNETNYEEPRNNLMMF